MLAELRDDNKQLAFHLKQTQDLCDEHGDVATASLLENWIDEAERMLGQDGPARPGCALAFGPGLTAEAMRFRLCGRRPPDVGWDVAVAGGGPRGAAAACHLARRAVGWCCSSASGGRTTRSAASS